MRRRGHAAWSDARLLAEADGPSFSVLYARHERAVLAYMMRRTSDPETAADLAAEVFAAALVSAASYRAEDGAPVIAWLFGIARNVLASSYRRAQVVSAARDQIGMASVRMTDETLDRLDAMADIAQGAEALSLLPHLPPEQREAIVEHVLRDRDYSDIATELECSQAVVRQRVSRGLGSLRKKVTQL